MSEPAPSNLSGNQRRKLRSAARFFAVQALFQMEATGQTADVIAREFADFRFGERFEDYEMAEADLGHFRKVVDAAVNWQALRAIISRSTRSRASCGRSMIVASRASTAAGSWNSWPRCRTASSGRCKAS